MPNPLVRLPFLTRPFFGSISKRMLPIVFEYELINYEIINLYTYVLGYVITLSLEPLVKSKIHVTEIKCVVNFDMSCALHT